MNTLIWLGLCILHKILITVYYDVSVLVNGTVLRVLAQASSDDSFNTF